MHWLNVFGLILNTWAAGIMLFYPPLGVMRYTPEGRNLISWVNEPTEKGRAIGRHQARLSKAGVVLLIVGFSCQLIAAIADAVLA